MIPSRTATRLVAMILLSAVCDAVAQAPMQGGTLDLGGTSWRLVKFQGDNAQTLMPDDGAKYTIAFNRDGSLVARIDCNRGRGTWKSAGPGDVEFGPLALTRAMCPPESLHDRIVKHLGSIRSYVVKDGHLFLSVRANGGVYEFEPLPKESS
jgi:para-nitrobenzyl esterase